MNKVRGGVGRMRSAAQITQAIEPLDGQRQVATVKRETSSKSSQGFFNPEPDLSGE